MAQSSPDPSLNGGDYPEDAFVELGIAGLYDEKDTVLELELL